MKRLLWIVPVLVGAFAVFALWPRDGGGPDPSRPTRDSVGAYKAEYKDDKLEPARTEVKVKKTETPLRAAVTEMLNQDKLFSSRVRLLHASIRSRTAVLDFSKELRSGFSTDEEEAFLTTLLTTAGQFPSIDDVQILIEGQKVESLSSAEISDPLPVIRPPSVAKDTR